MTARVPSAVLEGLLLTSLAFGPFAFGCVEPWSRAILETLLFATALACFLRGRTAASAAGAWAWLFPAAVAALGVIQASRTAAADGPWLLGPLSVAPHETAKAALLWAAYAALLYSVPRVVVSPGAARRYAWALFGVGLGVAVLGLAQAFTSKDLIYWTRATIKDLGMFGPYYDRDHAADLMLMSLALGGGLLVSSISRWSPIDGPLPGQWRVPALAGGGAALLFSAIVFCHSRGTLLAMPLAASVLGLAGSGLVRHPGKRAAGGLGALAVLSLVIFFAFAHVESGQRAGAPMDRSVSSRLTIYSDCARWAADAPFFGTGLGSFASVYPSYQDRGLRYFVDHAHSDWLEFCLETGLPGGACAVVALLALLSAGAGAWRRAASREMRPLIAGALAAVTGCAAHALFEFNLNIPANAAVFFSLAGFIFSASAWGDKSPRQPRSSPPEALPTAAALATFALACSLAVAPARAEWIVDRATTAQARFDSLQTALQRDDDPVYWRELARGAYEAAASPAALRLSLYCALKALAKRPYDGASLYYAGTSLLRLGRDADGRDMLRRRDLVAFSPYWTPPASDDDGGRRSLSRLRQLGLLPKGVTIR